MEWKYPYKTNPFDHQRNALKKSAETQSFAYFMEMGTGKTKTAIDNMGYLYLKNEIDTALVIAPKSVYTIWCKEIDIHLPDVVMRDIFQWKVDKPKNWNWFEKSKNLKIFLINVEALSNKNGFNTVVKFLKKFPKNYVVVDESTTIKNPKAKRTKFILELRKLIKFRRILTGSPVTKSPLDLYSQCYFLDPKLLGYESYYAFRNRYAEMQQIQMGANRYISIPKFYKNIEELEHKLDVFSFRVRKDQCLDLKPKVRQKRLIQLTGEQGILYEKLKRRALAVVRDTTVSFTNKLSEIVKLHQLTNGFIKDDDGNIQEFGKAKINALEEIIDETDDKIIIWVNYLHNIRQLKNFLSEKYGKESYVEIYGETKVKDRTNAIEAFQNNPKVRFFLSNPTTGGYGLTLTAAKTVVYFSNNYNLEVRKQSEDRAHRSGQTGTVVIIDIIAEKTIDENIMKALTKKGQIAAKTLGEEDLKDWLL